MRDNPAHPVNAYAARTAPPAHDRGVQREVGRGTLARSTAATAPASPPVTPWRPTQRPPVALLTVCDDGRAGGEVVRVRADRFIIGRTEGDLRIPHDPMVSTRHAEISREHAGGEWQWTVTDLRSTNGLFVRLSRSLLTDGREFLAGGGRYRFDAPDGGTADTIDEQPYRAPVAATVGPRDTATRSLALSEFVGDGLGNRVVLTRAKYWIGSAQTCDISRPGDPFCEPRQVRVYRSEKGWAADHPKTGNGLWVRLTHVVAGRTLQFQLGEQRFRLSAESEAVNPRPRA